MTNNIDLARRSDLSEEIIEKLMTIIVIAERENLSEYVIEKLADDDYYVRREIAKRKDLSLRLK